MDRAIGEIKPRGDRLRTSRGSLRKGGPEPLDRAPCNARQDITDEQYPREDACGNGHDACHGNEQRRDDDRVKYRHCAPSSCPGRHIRPPYAPVFSAPCMDLSTFIGFFLNSFWPGATHGECDMGRTGRGRGSFKGIVTSTSVDKACAFAAGCGRNCKCPMANPLASGRNQATRHRSAAWMQI